ncbi:hypothetical protein AAF712_016684 [Marasmius tenuissimus]|uniref:XPG-I domain-containing protein n=1 Tax=Marasmius tenuissimus TaxID=585030 RepID=A0ABR2Z5F4_9AGAR
MAGKHYIYWPILRIDSIGSELLYGVWKESHNGARTLKRFFAIMCKYSEAAAVLLFVFDSADSPQAERRREFKPAALDLHRDAIELIRQFGYYSTEVEGGADSYLASLSCSRIVDSVISEDANLLALGVDILLRQSHVGSTDELTYDVYSAAWIKEDTSLEREGIIFIALLCGNEVGVEGCDISVAVQLACLTLGKELVEAFKHLHQPKLLEDYVRSWRARVRDELVFNANGYLERQHPEVAAGIHEHFPSLEVLRYYVNSPARLPPDDATYLNKSLKPTLPNIAGLVSYCRERFQWSDGDVTQRFKLDLFKGAISRLLHSPLVLFNNQEQTFHDRTWKMELLREGHQLCLEQDIEQVEVTFSLAGLMKVAGLPVLQPMEKTLWIPLPVLRTAKLPQGLSQAQYDRVASGLPVIDDPGECCDGDVKYLNLS